MSQRCLACGEEVVVFEGILAPHKPTWVCLQCGSWGTISKAKDEPKKDEPVVKRRLEKTHG